MHAQTTQFCCFKETSYFSSFSLDVTLPGLTSEVRAVAQRGGNSSVARQNDDDALLYEVHLVADRRLADDQISGLENLVLELRDDVVDELLVRFGEERNGRHQRTTVIVDDLLRSQSFADPRQRYCH